MGERKSQGGQANYTGRILQEFIEARLRECGYLYMAQASFRESRSPAQAAYTRQCDIGPGIYGTPLKADYVLFHPAKWPELLAIEAKWQQAAGSVDEKYPYLEHNIKQCYPCPAVILLDGRGYKPGAAEWLRKQVDGRKLLHVFDMAQFTAWANQGHL